MTDYRLDSPAIAGHAMILPGLLTWKDLRNGVSAVRRLEENLPVSVGAPVPFEFPVPQPWPFAFCPRAVRMAHAVTKQLTLDIPDRGRLGIVLGMHNLFSETEYMEYVLEHREDKDAMAEMLGFSFDYPLASIAGAFKAGGPRLRVDSACATGNDALIAAYQWLGSGAVDDVIVVAATAGLNPVSLALFHNLKALSELDDLEASCPFDLRRRGFVMGEGAAAVWLTSRKEPRPLGYMVGYGQSLNADSFVDLPDDLEPMERACREAIGERGDEVAYVSAHGTATLSNDLQETRLYKHLFGARCIPMSSVKSMIGHSLGAASLIEAIVCLRALEEQIAPPTINLHQPDPQCDLDYVPNQAKPISGRYALSNAFAFGGQNACILLAGADS